jgi:hypothetical protein
LYGAWFNAVCSLQSNGELLPMYHHQALKPGGVECLRALKDLSGHRGAVCDMSRSFVSCFHVVCHPGLLFRLDCLANPLHLLPLLLVLLLSIWGAQAGSSSHLKKPHSNASDSLLTLENVVDLLDQAHAAAGYPYQPKP